MVKNVGISRFTEYASPCLKNEQLKKKIGSESPLVYRMFLQNNAGKLMNDNLAAAYHANNLECGCSACKKTCKVCGKSVNLNK